MWDLIHSLNSLCCDESCSSTRCARGACSSAWVVQIRVLQRVAAACPSRRRPPPQPRCPPPRAPRPGHRMPGKPPPSSTHRQGGGSTRRGWRQGGAALAARQGATWRQLRRTPLACRGRFFTSHAIWTWLDGAAPPERLATGPKTVVRSLTHRRQGRPLESARRRAYRMEPPPRTPAQRSGKWCGAGCCGRGPMWFPTFMGTPAATTERGHDPDRHASRTLSCYLHIFLDAAAWPCASLGSAQHVGRHSPRLVRPCSTGRWALLSGLRPRGGAVTCLP